MGQESAATGWRPTGRADRVAALDALRGAALLGVLVVNLESDFRVPLAEHLLTFHTDPGSIDRWADLLVAGLLEFKAFAVLSLLFGAGLAAFADRAAAAGEAPGRALARRLAVLLGLGLAHLLLVWNGDILTLYAVCGFLLLPLRRLPVPALAGLGAAAVAGSYLVPWGFLIPDEDALRGLAAEAGRVYPTGSPADVGTFHAHETRVLIVPLLIASVPKVWGLMALGAAAWAAGVFRDPARHRVLLWGVGVSGGLVGGTATALALYSTETGRSTGVPSDLLDAAGPVPLALGYAAGFLLAARTANAGAAGPLAAVGRTALTNYLAQSVVLGLLFYGYGLGLTGRVGPAAGLVIGLAVYGAQVGVSVWWLRRYRFGPAEWAWRSLTYGRPQPWRRAGATG